MPAVVLVVEDDPEVREIITEVLAIEGMTVLSAGSGPEALAILHSDQDQTINLLFTDVVMPGGMDGFELAQTAKQLRPDLPILYTSGYINERAATHQSSVDGKLFRKPYSLSEVVAEIRRSIGD